MATRSTETVPIGGRVDRDGRLVAADPALERLQVEAGSTLGRALALPQLAALARAAASLGVPLSRNIVAADRHNDLDLFVRAEPTASDGSAEVQLTIERWVARPMAPPRLALVEPVDHDERRAAERSALEFEVDTALDLIALSPALAALLGVDPGAALGRPLTSVFRLVEEADGSMPLLGAVATRAAVDGQRAVSRHDANVGFVIDADPAFDDEGRFAGFQGRIRGENEGAGDPVAPVFEDSLDEALRSPLARIISAAEHIVERGDGPLRSDYANYASDIAAAGRHLLSVIHAMAQGEQSGAQRINLDELAREAVGLVQPQADQRGIAIAIEGVDAPCQAEGEAHAVVQILVNILGNAVRYSPAGGSVTLSFARRAGDCRLTIGDEGPGIAPVDQHRIFERYERIATTPEGSGLGLAISRRLARAMGGDITLESAHGESARFTLSLPAA